MHHTTTTITPGMVIRARHTTRTGIHVTAVVEHDAHHFVVFGHYTDRQGDYQRTYDRRRAADMVELVRAGDTVTYHGSITALHGTYTVSSACDCGDCWDDLSTLIRYTLAYPDTSHPGPTHVRRESFTITAPTCRCQRQQPTGYQDRVDHLTPYATPGEGYIRGVAEALKHATAKTATGDDPHVDLVEAETAAGLRPAHDIGRARRGEPLSDQPTPLSHRGRPYPGDLILTRCTNTDGEDIVTDVPAIHIDQLGCGCWRVRCARPGTPKPHKAVTMELLSGCSMHPADSTSLIGPGQ